MDDERDGALVFDIRLSAQRLCVNVRACLTCDIIVAVKETARREVIALTLILNWQLVWEQVFT